jgi:hypothetical protein
MEYSAEIELHELCIALESRSVDAIALQEPNTDFMEANVREQCNKSFCKHFGQARLLTATACIPAARTWKPGGVVVVILGSWAQHVSKVQCNDLGRWLSATLTGCDGESCTIFSFYNVVNTKLQDAGPSIVFSQQYRLLWTGGVTHPAPR